MDRELDPGRFYSVAAVATRWGARPREIRRKINAGELRARRLGKGWGIHGTAILAYEAGTDFAPEPRTQARVLRPA